MLINSKDSGSSFKWLKWTILLVVLLLLLKFVVLGWGTATSVFGTKENAGDLETPTRLTSALNIEELFKDKKNQIYKKDNLSLFLNNEFGIPTIMAVYSDSISELERTGRFLAFIYLRDPSEWRRINKQYDHIFLAKETLVPVQMEINDTTRYIFNFGLRHPYFTIDNLKDLVFVRHTREFGRFEEIKFTPDSTHYIYPVSNSLDKLTITVRSKNFKKIRDKRAAALTTGILTTSDDDFVKATISADGKENINATVRLKGDWTDHLEHPAKWSYRIVPSGEETLFGMRKFSVQHPKSRNYLWEWLFNKVVKDNDLVGLRYDFLNVDLEIADRDSVIPMGIMALEESFDKILIENNRRREGLILGFDESRMWQERKKVKEMSLDFPDDVTLPKAQDLPVKVYNENKTLSSPSLAQQFKIAKNLIVGLRDQKLSLSEAFDIDKLTLYIALSNLFGGHHGLHIENVRIYYNPVTNKLEPVSFDSNSGIKLRELREYPVGIHDAAFREKLVEKYRLVSSQEFIDNFIRRYADSLNELSLNLSGEFNEAALDISILEHNANLIKKKIDPADIIHATLVGYDNSQMEIEIKNLSEFPVVAEDLVLANKKSLNENRKAPTINPGDTVRLKFKLKKSFNNAFVSKKNKEGGFRYPKDLTKIKLSHHILGSAENKYNPIQAFDSKFDEAGFTGMQLVPNFGAFDFIAADETASLTFRSGNHTLNETLFIPSGYQITVEAGFRLNLRNGASVISHSPLHTMGTQRDPVEFYSDDSSAGGLFITAPGRTSILSHTTFSNLSVPKLQLWALSGSVNFNETTVELSNCVFENNRSEDALNLIRSDFMMDSIQFRNTYSDAFDGDFVTGKITNSVFENAGNDGIDVSGSDIEVRNITIINPSDKGMSAGEGSTIKGNTVEIMEGEIGLVSKDNSRITLSGISIRNTRLAISCFQKKSEYGPGLIDLEGVDFSGNEVSYLIEPASDLIIDNKIILEKTEGVIEKMYGNEYGKSSK